MTTHTEDFIFPTKKSFFPKLTTPQKVDYEEFLPLLTDYFKENTLAEKFPWVSVSLEKEPHCLNPFGFATYNLSVPIETDKLTTITLYSECQYGKLHVKKNKNNLSVKIMSKENNVLFQKEKYSIEDEVKLPLDYDLTTREEFEQYTDSLKVLISGISVSDENLYPQVELKKVEKRSKDNHWKKKGIYQLFTESPIEQIRHDVGVFQRTNYGILTVTKEPEELTVDININFRDYTGFGTRDYFHKSTRHIPFDK